MADLPDVQSGADARAIPLQSAGVSCVEVPIQFAQGDIPSQQVQAIVTAGVSLPAEQRGVHMSRYMELIGEWSAEETLSCDIRSFLEQCASRLEADDACAHWKLKFFLDKPAPVSGKKAPMGYDIKVRGCRENGQLQLETDLSIIASNCCPCSKDIADVGAHNQRLELQITLRFDPNSDVAAFPLAQLIADLENQTSCPAHPLLKRTDEKAVTERQYEHAKFTEDVVRDCVPVLQAANEILGFHVRAIALESIHKHNAWAEYREGETCQS